MTTFQFKAVQLLQLGEADNPTIQIEDGILTITANREGDQIFITTPVPSTFQLAKQIPVQQVSRTVVKTSHKARKYSKENLPRGEEHSKAKLKEQDVREMRALFQDSQYRKTFSSIYAMCDDLAKAYGVHVTTVYKIVNGQSWRHVKDA